MSCVLLIAWLQAALANGPVANPDTLPTQQPEPAPLYASPTRLDRIGRVIAPVMINGKGPYRLVVDTGASHSTFSPQLAASLGLTPSFDSPLLLNGVTGAAQVPTIRVDSIRAGELVIQDVQVPVIFSSIMSNADGILGVAGLRRERIEVDFRHDRIVVSRSPTHIDNAKGFIAIPARIVAGGLLVVDARIGGVRARAVIDTGAERTLGNLQLRDALRARQRSGTAKWASTDVYGATPDIAVGETSIAPPIRIGPATIRSTEVVFGDFHIFKVWKLDDRPAALIGMDVLGTVESMIIDYRRRELLIDVRPPGAKSR